MLYSCCLVTARKKGIGPFLKINFAFTASKRGIYVLKEVIEFL